MRISKKDKLNEQFLIACENADIPQARKLLQDGASVETRNHAGETALHLAVKSGDERIVEFLTHSMRLNADLKDAFGRTPLHWAAQQGNVPITEVLLLAHADIEAKDEAGLEPKIYAEMGGSKELIKLFSIVRKSRK